MLFRSVYLFSDRIVLPAVVVHIVINLAIEPGLLLNGLFTIEGVAAA